VDRVTTGAAARRDGADWDGLSRRLEAQPVSAVLARYFVADLLTSRAVPETVLDDAVLLTDELVSNAVQHASGAIEVVVIVDHDRIRVTVSDDSQEPPVKKEISPDSTSGRGLLLVDLIASRWGVTPTAAGGKDVWFELLPQWGVSTAELR
jgi:anti-sigma regulatory factor (Ser/Thr protein kinase)